MSEATDFWQVHQVAECPPNREASVQMLLDRVMKFPGLLDLMPVNFPGKKILDFGCGPGHDTLCFLEYGAAHVWFVDISWQALDTTSRRLRYHGISDMATALFADDDLPEVDHFHSAGVLHHMQDPLGALMRLRLAANTGRVMVYDGEKSEHSTSLVPITEWWTHKQFIKMCAEAEWAAEYVGSYECSAEWRPNCWAACYALK